MVSGFKSVRVCKTCEQHTHALLLLRGRAGRELLHLRLFWRFALPSFARQTSSRCRALNAVNLFWRCPPQANCTLGRTTPTKNSEPPSGHLWRPCCRVVGAFVKQKQKDRGPVVLPGVWIREDSQRTIALGTHLPELDGLRRAIPFSPTTGRVLWPPQLRCYPPHLPKFPGTILNAILNPPLRNHHSRCVLKQIGHIHSVHTRERLHWSPHSWVHCDGDLHRCGFGDIIHFNTEAPPSCRCLGPTRGLMHPRPLVEKSGRDVCDAFHQTVSGSRTL